MTRTVLAIRWKITFYIRCGAKNDRIYCSKFRLTHAADIIRIDRSENRRLVSQLACKYQFCKIMAPKFKVGAHVITYTLFLGVSTCAAFAISEIYSVSEEEKLRVLVSRFNVNSTNYITWINHHVPVFQREKYPAQIKKQEMQHKDIQEFFNNMKNGQSPELETKFNG